MLKTQAMRLDYIRTFIIVCQSKNFRDAANKLNVDFTNISRHISALEEIMETKLINRKSKSMIELTEDGKILFDGWQKGYNLLLLTEKNFIQRKSLNAGKISIGVPRGVEEDFLTNKIMAFKAKYPSVIIKILNYDTNTLFKHLSNYYLDFVIDEVSENFKYDTNIKSINLKTYKFVLAYSPKYFDKKISCKEDINNIPLILPTTLKQERLKFEKIFGKDEVKESLTLEVTNYDAAKKYALNGLGYALLPKDKILKNELNYFEIEELNKNISISYVIGNLSPSAKEFLKTIIDNG